MHIFTNPVTYVIVLNNLQVITIMLLGGPAPAPVCALSCNVYSVSGDNPSTVAISMLSVMLITVPSSNLLSYSAIKNFRRPPL